MAAHFTAVVSITKVIETEAKVDPYGKQATPATRSVDEVAKIVVRDSDLDSLTNRVAKHLQLVEDNS